MRLRQIVRLNPTMVFPSDRRKGETKALTETMEASRSSIGDDGDEGPIVACSGTVSSPGSDGDDGPIVACNGTVSSRGSFVNLIPRFGFHSRGPVPLGSAEYVPSL